MLETSLIN